MPNLSPFTIGVQKALEVFKKIFSGDKNLGKHLTAAAQKVIAATKKIR